MPEAVEVRTDEHGRICCPESLSLPPNRRALLVILDEPPISLPSQTVTSKSRDGDEVGTRPWDGRAPSGATRYRIDRILAEGGMGRAYIGTDLTTGQPVCIKQLRPGFPAELLVHEWRSLARVDSRYVARFLDRYTHGGTLHLVMEYIDGPTLSHRLKVGMSLGECVWLGLALMRGVQAFHQVGVIHCDLKPQNVLIQEVTVVLGAKITWEPKIIDFGIALLDRRDATEVETREGSVAGTPAYMAPEQVLARMLSPACDVYAVGLMLWEALSGRSAYTGAAVEIMFAKKIASAGLRVGADRFSVPAALVEIVENCTHPDPARRPTAEEAARRLEEIAEGGASEILELD